jgi:hypothetical protein
MQPKEAADEYKSHELRFTDKPLGFVSRAIMRFHGALTVTKLSLIEIKDDLSHLHAGGGRIAPVRRDKHDGSEGYSKLGSSD